MTYLVAAFEQIVGRANVLCDPEIVVSYATDWTGRFCGHTPAVVRPGSTEEVSAVIAACASEHVALTPQGGNTGLVGGGVPMNGECVLSLTRLESISDCDELSGQLTAGAGATVSSPPHRSGQRRCTGTLPPSPVDRARLNSR